MSQPNVPVPLSGGSNSEIAPPSAPSDVPVPAAPPGTEPEASGALAGSVLVVDDDSGVRVATRLLLEAMGFDALTAADGREAIDLVGSRRDQIAVVLLDLTLPDLAGLEALDELRRLRPDLPILISSGHAPEEALERCHDGGLTAFLPKPYRAAQLRMQLLELVSPGADSAGAAP